MPITAFSPPPLKTSDQTLINDDAIWSHYYSKFQPTWSITGIRHINKNKPVGITGDASGVEGYAGDLKGDITGFSGDISWINGDLSCYRSHGITNFDDFKAALINNGFNFIRISFVRAYYYCGDPRTHQACTDIRILYKLNSDSYGQDAVWSLPLSIYPDTHPTQESVINVILEYYKGNTYRRKDQKPKKIKPTHHSNNRAFKHVRQQQYSRTR